MNIGISMSISPDMMDASVLAEKAEELGFESFWVPEHGVIPVNTNSRYGGSADGSIPESMRYIPDPFVVLARVSARTTNIKLGTGVCLVPEHNPLLLAKEIATLDYFSGGRFLFGIGAGWLKEESEILGGNFEHRWGQTREAILAMKELWTKDEAEFHGRYYDFPAVRSYPKPASQPHPPVLLGGFASNVFKRVASWGDGWIPTRATPDQVRMGRATIDELASAAGRDPSAIEISAFGAPADPDEIKRYEDAGASRVIVRRSATGQRESLEELEQIAEKVLA